MGAKVRIELNHDGIRELLSSAPIAAECEKAAQRIADRAGAGFVVTSQKKAGFGGGRTSYGVATATNAARRAEADEKRLSKAVSQCRS